MNILQRLSQLASWTPNKKDVTAASSTSVTIVTGAPGAAGATAGTPADASKPLLTDADLKVEDMTAKPDAAKPPVDDASRRSLFKLISGKIGMDLSVGFSLPVQYCEPTTNLSRMAEYFEFQELLSQAAVETTPIERLATLVLFVISGFSNTERYAKPFNPLLGETFEYVDPNTGLKFFAEQTSHHPPISASYAEGKGYYVTQHVAPTTKFLGNSIDIFTNTKIHIYFPGTGDHFTYVPPQSRVHNLIIGRTWIDHFGDFEILNVQNGDKAVVKYSKCGWMGKSRYEVHALCYTAQGLCCARVTGKWNERATAQWVSEAVRFQYMEALLKEQTGLDASSVPPAPSGSDISAPLIIGTWSVPPVHFSGKYSMTEFCKEIHYLSEEDENVLISTDSRLRPDRRALEFEDIANAAIYKGVLEEKQRSDRKNNEVTHFVWTPKWFNIVPPTEEGGETAIEYKGGYWEAKEEAASQGKDFCPSDLQGLACDFRSYGYNPPNTSDAEDYDDDYETDGDYDENV